MGRTWMYSGSEFPVIGGGQRLILMRLREGPILFASFTDSKRTLKDNNPVGMTIVDAARAKRTVYGLFVALSFDEGGSWPLKRLVTDDGPGRELDGGGHTHRFIMDHGHAEPKGYLAATQTPDGVIHLISSALHYRFNLAWLKQLMPASQKVSTVERVNL